MPPVGPDQRLEAAPAGVLVLERGRHFGDGADAREMRHRVKRRDFLSARRAKPVVWLTLAAFGR
jgi:hypothetical protein